MILWLPGPATALAIALGAAMPIALAVFSRRPVHVESPQRRFLLVVALDGVIWVAWALFGGTRDNAPLWSDLIAGALILYAAIVSCGILWSLICWGFTTSLLAALCRRNRPATRSEWFADYGGGSSLHGFTRDRLRILTALDLVEEINGSIRVKGHRGRLIGAAVVFARLFFGLGND